MSIRDLFDSSDKPQSWGNRFRNKRFEFLREKLEQLPKPVKILDVGGLESFWTNRGYGNDPDYQITILNLEKLPVSSSNFKSQAGDATRLDSIGDQEFDVAFSNSVIEHLYTIDNQKAMAAEVLRVGKYHFVQTPNKYFPVEPHYVLPFFDPLPASLKYTILTRTRLSRLKKWDKQDARQYVDEIRLLSFREFKWMFPDSRMYKEMFMGMVKSFTAHNF
ncbi:MAG TPA: class I SAM-dependent methyltransferase [Sphingobacteriaceae bacterium]